MNWPYQAGGPIATSASIVGTTAYVGSWDGYEYAINTQTGALIWKTYLGITTDPGCNPVNNRHHLVRRGGQRRASTWAAAARTCTRSTPATGAVLWKIYTGDNSQAGAHYNWSSPLIVGNYAYIGIASNCDNPLVQGQLLEVPISGPQQGQIVTTYNFVPNGQVGGGIWTTPDLRPGHQHDLRVDRHTQRPHADPVAGDRRAERHHPDQYVSSWQLPFGASVARLRLGDDAHADHRRGRGPAAVGGQQERHPLHLQPQQPVRGAGLAAPDRRRRRLPDLRRRNHRFRHLRERHAVLRRRPQRASTGTGRGGSITAFDPGTGNVLWSQPDRLRRSSARPPT